MYYLPNTPADSHYPFPSYPYQSAAPSSPPFHGHPQHSSCSPPASPSNSFENIQSLGQFPVNPITYTAPVHPNNVYNNNYYAYSSSPNSFYQSQHSNSPHYPVHSRSPPSHPNLPPQSFQNSQYLSRSPATVSTRHCAPFNNSIAVAPSQTIHVPQSLLTPTSPAHSPTPTRPVPEPLEPSPKGPISYSAVAAKSPPPKSPTSPATAIKRNVTETAKVASKASKRREEIDLDRMTKKNGGKLMHCEYSAKMQKFNSRRRSEVEKMLALHEQYNRFLDKDVMDLHYLPCTMAKEAFCERLTEIKAGKRPNEIYVVTGRGVHSQDKNPVIKRCVRGIVDTMKFKCEEMAGNAGVLIINCTKIRK